MSTEHERLVWKAIVAESARRRRRRRAGLLSASVTGIVLAAFGVAQLPTSQPVTRVAAGPSGAGPVLASADPRSIAGGPIPSLGRLFAVPACSNGTGELASWMAAALGPYAPVDASAAASVPFGLVAETVPVPRSAPPDGSCALAVQAGDARAWELRSRGGELLGRGAGLPAPSRVVPSRLTAQRSLYHQERVASGQPFSGVIDGPHLDGLSSTSAVVLDVPAIPTTATEPHAAGVQILEQLTYASTASIGLDVAFQLPTKAPAGFTRCTDNIAYLRATSGTVVEFCDASGRTVTVVWTSGGPGVAAGQPVDLNGTAGRVSAAGDETMAVAADLEITGSSDLHLQVTGPAALSEGALVEMVRSIPGLDRRVFQPRGGDNDLRPVVVDKDKLAALLVEAGASGVTFPPPETCPSRSVAPAGPVPTTISVPCPIPRGVDLTVPAGSVAKLFTTAVAGAENPFGGLRQVTSVETVAGVDVLQRETAGTAAPRNAAQQAVFVCGKVWFNFVGNEVFDFVRILIPLLGC